jgi:hypothetical protein
VIIGHGRLTRLTFFFEPVAFAADVDDGGTVQQAVQGGGSQHGIVGEDLAPIAEGLVAGQGDGLLSLVALADDLEQQAGLQRVQGQVAHLIDDQQLGLDQGLELSMEPIAVDGLGEPLSQVHGGGEVDAPPEAAVAWVPRCSFRLLGLSRSTPVVPHLVAASAADVQSDSGTGTRPCELPATVRTFVARLAAPPVASASLWNPSATLGMIAACRPMIPHGSKQFTLACRKDTYRLRPQPHTHRDLRSACQREPLHRQIADSRRPIFQSGALQVPTQYGRAHSGRGKSDLAASFSDLRNNALGEKIIPIEGLATFGSCARIRPPSSRTL